MLRIVASEPLCADRGGDMPRTLDPILADIASLTTWQSGLLCRPRGCPQAPFRNAKAHRMRLCPSVEGSASPLITHRIGAEVCLARQATNFHKCHRCVYRGEAADWAPDAPGLSMAADAPGVVIPRPEPKKTSVAANG